MIALLFALAAHAADLEPPWWVGQPVAEVRLFAPDGGLPEESLDPLLQARQGARLTPSMLKLDLNTLFRVGEFSAVEADVEPWFTYGDDDELREAVAITYFVYSAPRISRIRVEGVEVVSRRAVLDAARLSVGEVFYPEIDGVEVAAHVRALLVREGLPSARVTAEPLTLEDGTLEVVLRVEEGPRQLVDRISFTGELPVPEARLRRWARKEGVVQGGPLWAEEIPEAAFEMRRKLARPPTLWRPAGGWVESRVTPAVNHDGLESQVTFSVEPGRQLLVDVEGLGWRGRSWVRQALSIDERLRLTRGFLEQAPDNVEGLLQRRGYFGAEVEVELLQREDTQHLRVRVDKGPLHRLNRGDVRVRGAEILSSAEVRTLMEQASYDVIRVRRVTAPELDKAIGAVQTYYRSVGHLGATVEIANFDPDVRPTPWPTGDGNWTPFMALSHAARPKLAPRRVQVDVQVREGPLTTLRELEIHGQADDADLAFFERARERFEGGPYSPQRLEALARQVTEAHRAAGHLDADARVVPRKLDGDAYDAAIMVTSGAQVLLRSVVTRGASRTHVPFLRNQLDLELGQPLTSRDLEQIRETLYQLDVFRTVQTELLGDDAGRDLVLALQERPRYGLELGAGFSSDQGVRGFGRFTRRNLWGRAHRADLNVLLGIDNRGESVLRFLPRRPEFRAAGSYTAPRFPLSGQDLVVDILFQERLQERTYELARTGAGLFLDSAFGATQLRGGVRFEARRIVQLDPGVLLPGEVWTKLAELDRSWRPQHALTAFALHDLRDDPVRPTRGLLFSLQADWAPDLSTTRDAEIGVSFLRGEARLSGLVPVGGVTLRLSGEGGHARMLKGGVLPLEERFQLGGTGSMRGFKRDGIGPRQEVSQIDVDWPDALEPVIDHSLADQPLRWVPTGGDTRATATAELLVPLPVLGLPAWDGYSAAVFADVGNVWWVDPIARAATSDAFRPPLRYGLGAGMRMATPIGPLQVDLATNLHALTGDAERQKLLRELWEEPSLRAHLSLGALF